MDYSQDDHWRCLEHGAGEDELNFWETLTLRVTSLGNDNYKLTRL
jgi:hypothetical protein